MALYFLNVNWGWKHLPATVATIIPFLGSNILNWNAGRENLRVVYSLSCHSGGWCWQVPGKWYYNGIPRIPPNQQGSLNGTHIGRVKHCNDSFGGISTEQNVQLFGQKSMTDDHLLTFLLTLVFPAKCLGRMAKVQLASKRVLAASLGFSAGIMQLSFRQGFSWRMFSFCLFLFFGYVFWGAGQGRVLFWWPFWASYGFLM